jgi:hypothetical protein
MAAGCQIYISQRRTKSTCRALLTPVIVIVWLLYHPFLAGIIVLLAVILLIWLKRNHLLAWQGDGSVCKNDKTTG